MRIATMVRGYLPSPPGDIAYAPYYLAETIGEGLAARGHDVTFFAPVGSHVQRAALETLGQTPLATDAAGYHALLANADIASHGDLHLADQYFALAMFRRAARGEFDVLHFHHPEVALPYAALFPNVPVVSTLHDPISERQRAALERWHSANHQLVSISNSQRAPAPDLPYAVTIYNGINTNLFAFNNEPDEGLLFVGSMMAHKGPDIAIDVATAVGRRLTLIGHHFPDKANRKFFETKVRPRIDGDRVRYLGPLPHNELAAHMRRAWAFLMPIQWEEPFGLVMAEAMACGTPVVAFGRGSVPEIIADGRSGLIVHTFDEMVNAVQRVATLSRAACRAHVEANFSQTRMVDAYEQLFRRLSRKPSEA